MRSSENMPEHDPMSSAGPIVESDTVNPWQALARQARWLADQAERVSALPPAERIATDPNDDETDQITRLESRELAIRSLLSACRRDTYATLIDQGWTVQQIADERGVSYQAVRKVLQHGKS